MKRACLIPVFCLLFFELSLAQSSVPRTPRFDLANIGMVVNGKQICGDKGRLQDFGSKVMDQIIAEGPKSVPILIEMIADTRPAKTKEPIICYWYGMTIGDIAFCTLSDLFTDATYAKTTLPGATWNDLLGHSDGPAWEQLDNYIKKHGRAALQAKWRALWNKYKDQIVWDAKQRCFVLKQA